MIFQPIRSQHLTVTPKNGKLPKMIFGKIKEDTPEPLPRVIPEKNNRKIVTSEGQKNTITVEPVAHHIACRSVQ